MIRVRITDDGNARWTIENRFLVTNDTEAETFRNYSDAVVSGDHEEPYDLRAFERTVDDVADSTGRDMSVENAGWDDPRIEPLEADGEQSSDGNARVGVISYSFTWTNFAVVDGDRIYVGDAFRTDDTLLFSVLNSWQRLVIEPPDNYGFVDVPTGTENGALVWNGPYEFDETGLEITILRGADTNPESPGTDGSNSLLPTGMWGWLIAVGIVLVVLAAGGYFVVRRTDRVNPSAVVPSLERIEPSAWLGRRERPTDTPGEITDETKETDATPEPAAEPTVAAGTESGTHLEFEEPVGDAVDPELLSDEERVLRMLKQNGGRMKQASIVSETGWSNAKVSQLLSQMDDDDEIEKLRIGRENLITLPGVDPTEVD
ncbi:hypothetical protein C478_01300 [Natrinema thermotolerans DSM 11552]|nr:hypothetical protein C478_01300 [Natrinema thermotolerans DSM 11552]